MASQILIRVDKELKQKFQRLSKLENKSVNEKIKELMDQYVQEHDMESALRRLWSEIGSSLKKKGYKAKDVERIIREVRSER